MKYCNILAVLVFFATLAVAAILSFHFVLPSVHSSMTSSLSAVRKNNKAVAALFGVVEPPAKIPTVAPKTQTGVFVKNSTPGLIVSKTGRTVTLVSSTKKEQQPVMITKQKRKLNLDEEFPHDVDLTDDIACSTGYT